VRPKLLLSILVELNEKWAVASDPSRTRHHAREILGVSAARAKLDTMGKERRHYPGTIYVLTVLCGLGLACVAIGIADGWVFIAAGVAAIAVSLVRLHVILDRRRTGAGPKPLPLDRAAAPKD
jgi:hypothetical protein